MFDLLVHADWSISEAKRWATIATRNDDRWSINAPIPGQKALAYVSVSKSRSHLVGFDFPIGVPAHWGKQTGLTGFKNALRVLGTAPWHQFCEVAKVESEISIHRPFYPQVSSASAKQIHLTRAHNAPDIDALRRWCDLATKERPAACSLFWTLGPNQVGKAALAGWREIIIPWTRSGARIWPFDGRLNELNDSAGLTIVETYPAEAYRHIGVKFSNESKRSQAARASNAAAFRYWAGRSRVSFSTELLHLVDDGFGSGPDGEDKFDALAGMCGMIEVVDGRRAEGTPDDEIVRSWEGWILGQQCSTRSP